MDVDPTDVTQAGWGIVFHENVSTEIREAIQPLVEHRQSTVPPDRCKVLEYRSGQGLKDWLKDQGVHIGSVAPTKVPYYLLLIGDPSDIPFSFQCLLNVEYAVGRLSFDSAELYHNYAQSVIRYETASQVSNSKEVAYWGVRHDKATEMSADYLISPLYRGESEAGRPVADDWSFGSQCSLADDATRSNLLRLFKDRAPAMLCTASHGLGWKHGQVENKRQMLENGALCSQDWDGEGPIKMEHYITGEDITEDLHVDGMVAFLFACYGVGTPEKNYFVKPGKQIERIADRSFVSAIPQKLLGHPNGSALAVLGHVDMAWSYSFKPPKIGQQLQPFRNMIGRIISGQPVGHSTRDFSERYAALSTELLSSMDRSQVETELSAKKLARLWTERNDAQNYIMLGDPAAAVRSDAMGKSQKRTAEASSRQAPIQLASTGDSATSRYSTTTEIEEGASLQEYAAPPMSQAAPSATPSIGGDKSGSSSSRLAFLGTLRAIRAEAQNLARPVRRLLEIDLQSENAQEQSRIANQDALATRNRSLDRIKELRSSLYRSIREDVFISDWCSDEVTHVENSWGRIVDDWPDEKLELETLRKRFSKIAQMLRKIILLAGQLTIPSRVDQHLESLRIGQSFDFHKAFQDELPDEADRRQVLGFMRDHPEAVSGVIVPESGVIYRASPHAKRRLLSYAMVVGMVIVGSLLIQLAGKMEIWPTGSTLKQLHIAYVFLVVGAIAHLVVGALKQSREKANAGLVALEDWLLWFHVRESSLILSVLYLWIGMVGITFVFRPPIVWETAIFVGYSIDSFVDLFLQKFTTRAAKDVSTLSSAK